MYYKKVKVKNTRREQCLQGCSNQYDRIATKTISEIRTKPADILEADYLPSEQC